MKLFYYVLFFFISTSCSFERQKRVSGDFYFVMNDGEVTKLSLGSDTVFEYKCYATKECVEKPQKHYKIVDGTFKEGKYLLKLERLDTIQLTKYPYPDNRFSILILNQIDSNRISFIQQLYGLNKNDISKNYVDTFETKNKFGFTYYSSNYYEKLKKLKIISNKNEVEQIISVIKTKKFVQLIELYKVSHPSDMYAAGLSAELLNQACIDLGFNPIGAGTIINNLMTKM